ncbi:MAG: group II truncated hemoglobin [Novosphingobium sp.]
MASAAETVPNTPFHLLGGHDTFQAIVDRFYDLMDSDPAYAELRAMHAGDLTRMRTELTRFLTGWAGGPRDWFEDNPGRCMMSVHKPYTITQQVAGQWADAMTHAIADVAPARADLAAQLTQLLGDLARGMGR